MKIWRLEVDFQGFQSFKLVNEERKYLKSFKEKIFSATKMEGDFIGELIELVEGEVKTDFPKFWSASGTPLISKKSAEIFAQIISEDAELIPVKYVDDKYYLVNTLTVIDAIDRDNSEFSKLDTGLVVGLEKYGLKSQIIEGHNIFKLYLNGRIMTTEVFVSDTLKKAVEEAKLKGFKFVEVWSE